MNFIAIDFETANNNRESACSIGIAVVENSKITQSFTRLIKPIPNYFEPRNVSIHHITAEMTANEPDFSEQWKDLQPYFDCCTLVAHNASFDFSVLRKVLEAYDLTFPSLDYYCSYLTFKKHHIEYQNRPRLVNYKLPTVCRELGVHDLDHHQAESDAIASARIMIQIFKDHNASSFTELEEKLNISPGNIYPNSYTPFHDNARKGSYHQHQLNIIPRTVDVDPGHPFYQKRVVFTGQLGFGLSRDDAKKVVADMGGIVQPANLSSKTNFLVVGEYDKIKYGENYKSGTFKKAEKLRGEGKDIEILTDSEFLEMVHVGDSSFEIQFEQIENDSEKHLKRNKYNDFSNKKIYFSSDLSVDRIEAFQHVGNCSGYGHDYDDDELPLSDYFVISEKHIQDLKKGIKSESILKLEKVRNSAQNRGKLKNVQLLREKTFLEYIDRREKFQRKQIEMRLYEWEIEEELRLN